MKSSLFRQAAFFFYAEKQAENEPIRFFCSGTIKQNGLRTCFIDKKSLYLSYRKD